MPAVKGKKNGGKSAPARKPARGVASSKKLVSAKKLISSRKVASAKKAVSKNLQKAAVKTGKAAAGLKKAIKKTVASIARKPAVKSAVKSLKDGSKKNIASLKSLKSKVVGSTAKSSGSKQLKPQASKASPKKPAAKLPSAHRGGVRVADSKTERKTSKVKAGQGRASEAKSPSVKSAATKSSAAKSNTAKAGATKATTAKTASADVPASKKASKAALPASQTRTTTVPKDSAKPKNDAATAPAATKAVTAPVAKAPAARGGRRPKLRLSGEGSATAAWLINNEPSRPSSFIPAPPRAESPFSVAAPPASSDRLMRPDDLDDVDSGLRTHTVRVDVEQGAGKTVLAVYPDEISLRVGEGIEWDFRYLGGSDATVDEVVIEFEKPGPFDSASFKSRKPGSNRPHRQISGAAKSGSANTRVTYTIRCLNLIKSEIARTKPVLNVTPMLQTVVAG